MRHEFNIKIRRPAEKSVFNAIIGEKFFNTVITELKQFNITTSGLKVLSRFGVLNNKIKSVQNIVTRIKMRFGTFRNNVVSTQELVLSVARNLTPIFTDENIKIKSSQYFNHLMYMLRIKADNILVGAQNLATRIKMRMPMTTNIVLKQNLVSRLNMHNTFYSNIKSGQSIVVNIFELLKLWYWDNDDFEDIDNLTLMKMDRDTGLYFATIIASYPVGSTCTCSNGSTILTAKRFEGTCTFHIPHQGEWNISCTDGRSTASQMININIRGSLVRSTLAYEYATFKKYSVTSEWESYVSASLSGKNIFGNPDFLYVVGEPHFQKYADTAPAFDFTGGITSKSLERDYGVRAWVANSDSIKSDPSTGFYYHFAFVSMAHYSLWWYYDATVYSIRKKADMRGTYLETITAPYGQYPINGIQDGYWWIREGGEHFDTDKALNKGSLIDLSGWSTIEYLDVPDGCTNITIETGMALGDHDCLCEYDANRNYLSYWGAGANPRTFTFDYPGQIKFIRATFLMSAIDDCYIYDNTNGQYIWKGKNVT